ncbi:hypothetical protein BJY00DRAFT_284617 [Aspergillus carlsbadensis]|nr:hypothetical protein BJY00DRAFT_284617 [Aspergillus carlsbadensis]
MKSSNTSSHSTMPRSTLYRRKKASQASTPHHQSYAPQSPRTRSETSAPSSIILASTHRAC